MGTLDGKVAFISGIARGQGRSHAVRLASEGADIIGIDICHDIETMDYPNATPADLDETAKLVERTRPARRHQRGRVRDFTAVRHAVDAGVTEFGRLDIVLSNAGIVRLHPADEAQIWKDTLEINLTGGFHVLRDSPAPDRRRPRRLIILTGSTAGVPADGRSRRRRPVLHGVEVGARGIGMQLAATLAAHSIRVNVVHPTGVPRA